MKNLFTNEEFGMLLLHMNIMRNSIKKGFKKSYGRNEGKEKLSVYDSIITNLNDSLEIYGEKEYYDTDLNYAQIDMLDSFINFYVDKLEQQAAGEKINHEGNETFLILNSVKEKVKVVVNENIAHQI